MTAEEHSLIVVNCGECSSKDIVTLLEHPQESTQHSLVCDGHDTVAAEHHEDTGHNVDVKRWGGTPEEMREKARSLASEMDGVDEEAFTPEAMA